MSRLYEIDQFQAPVANKIPKVLSVHDDERIDNYYWLNDREDKNVLAYLNSENDYREKVMAHTKDAQEALYQEIIARIKKDDNTVPYKYNGYYYQTLYEDPKEYPIHVRYKDNLKAPKEVMLDVNELAKGFDYFAVGGKAVSPDNTWLIYGEDTVSRRIYTLKFKNLSTGETSDIQIPGTTGSAVWANDNKTIFYTKRDPETLRAHQIFKHTLGSNPKKDELVYNEVDNTFSCSIGKTKSKQFLIIGSYQTISQEYQYLDANKPDGKFKLFEKRAPHLEYSVAHFGDHFYIRTNKDKATNFKIMKCPVGKTAKEHWEDFVPHRSDVLVQGVDIFNDHIVISERDQGVTQLLVKPWKGKEYRIPFEEEAFMAYTSVNPEFDSHTLRLGYTSLTTPITDYDFDMNTKVFTQLKQQEVVDDTFDPANYQSERFFVAARDGAKVPVSLVYKKGFVMDGKQPLLLYAYGSYGSSMDPYFSSVRLSLLNRGFAFAIAHVRGGEEMGRQWYKDGKLLNKKNTFFDFIDCADYLVKKKYTGKDGLFAMGGSAGGLLMGAIMNYRPELWKGVIAAVPFVDVITTMLDDTIPLTTFEYDEWGNPKDKKYYDYIKSYSPYDNVEVKDYPSTLVTTGLHDSQVQYFEPAKWVARLRVLKTDKNPLLFYCNMDAGHGGASGRFRRFKETAMEYAFMLDLVDRLD